jgi:ATP-dependent RNA helicase DBP3
MPSEDKSSKKRKREEKHIVDDESKKSKKERKEKKLLKTAKKNGKKEKKLKKQTGKDKKQSESERTKSILDQTLESQGLGSQKANSRQGESVERFENQEDFISLAPFEEKKNSNRGDDKSWGKAKNDFFNNYQEHPNLKRFSQPEIEKFREKFCMGLEGNDSSSFKPARTFEESSLPSDILAAACSEFSTPTPIQSQCWPIVLAGRDIIGIAATGSGKTIAFLLPALVHSREKKRLNGAIVGRSFAQKGGNNNKKCSRPSILILSPTRELAQQSADICEKTCALTGLQSACLYGGVPKPPQIQILGRGVEIVIGTPGRLLDLANDGFLSLEDITYLVLDEADRMLDMGFEPAIRALVEQIQSPRRQTLMFSATWPMEIRKMASEYLSNPIRVTIGSQDLSANHNVTQIVEVIDPFRKDNRLQEILLQHHNKQMNKILIFALYKKEAARLEFDLRRKGWKVQAIHGDMTQSARTQAMNGFRDGSCKLLVATDVAARGLDIDDVEFVINYTFPLTIEDYVHRIGRTGRAGKKGTSYTFFTQHDKQHAAELVTILNEAKQTVPESMLQFGMATKKKEHKLYGAHFKDIDHSMPSKVSHTRYGSDDE